MSTAAGLNPYVPPSDPEYDIERIAWRAQLTDVDCRSIAYEYRVALSAYEKHGGPPPDDCLVDAWEEYHLRFGDGSPHQEFVKKPSAVKPRRKPPESQGRRGFDRISPLYNERGELI